MAELNDTLVNGDLRVTGKIYGTSNIARDYDENGGTIKDSLDSIGAKANSALQESHYETRNSSDGYNVYGWAINTYGTNVYKMEGSVFRVKFVAYPYMANPVVSNTNKVGRPVETMEVIINAHYDSISTPKNLPGVLRVIVSPNNRYLTADRVEVTTTGGTDNTTTLWLAVPPDYLYSGEGLTDFRVHVYSTDFYVGIPSHDPSDQSETFTIPTANRYVKQIESSAKLSDSTSSNDSTVGASSAAVKAAMDEAKNKTPAAHNQASNTINAMTGYSKASSASAIATTDSLNTAIGKLEKALDGKQASGSYAAASHNQASNTINAMTGYSKASSASAIATTDSLNTAIGKLEKALDGKQASGSYASSSHTHSGYMNTDASNAASGAAKNVLNTLEKGESNISNDDVCIPTTLADAAYPSGSDKGWYYRPVKNLVPYIKGKLDGTYVPLSGNATIGGTKIFTGAIQNNKYVIDSKKTNKTAGYIEVLSITCDSWLNMPIMALVIQRGTGPYMIHAIFKNVEAKTPEMYAYANYLDGEHYGNVPLIYSSYVDSNSVRTYQFWVKKTENNDVPSVNIITTTYGNEHTADVSSPLTFSTSLPTEYEAVYIRYPSAVEMGAASTTSFKDLLTSVTAPSSEVVGGSSYDKFARAHVRFDRVQNGTSDVPSGFPSGDGMVVTIPWSYQYGRQILYDDNSHLTYSRYYDKGNASSWVTLFDKNGYPAALNGYKIVVGSAPGTDSKTIYFL